MSRLIKRILIGLIIIILDYGIFAIIGLYLMNYGDFYTASEGPYWSWESFEKDEKVAVVALYTWIGINVIAIGFILFRIYKNLTHKRNNYLPIK